MLLLFWRTASAPTPIVQSTGAGGGYKRGYSSGERRSRGIEWDKRDTAQDIEGWLRDAYAEIHGETAPPEIEAAAAEVVAPYQERAAEIDWTALAQSAEAVRRIAEIYDRHLKALERRRVMEEEAAFMLLMQ